MNQMLKNYWMALTHPSTATFEELKGSVKTSHTLIGLIIAGLIAGLIGIAQALFKIILSGARAEALIGGLIGGVIGLVVAPIVVLVLYYIAQAIVWVIAKLFGGKGGLGLQANLNATFGVPLGIIGVILGAIPFIGQVLSSLINLYALFPLTLSLSVVHEYSKVKAFLTWFVIFVVVFLCTICFLVLLGPQIASVYQRMIQEMGSPPR